MPAILIQTVPHLKICCPGIDKQIHFALRCNPCHLLLLSKINLNRKAAVSKTFIMRNVNLTSHSQKNHMKILFGQLVYEVHVDSKILFDRSREVSAA